MGMIVAIRIPKETQPGLVSISQCLNGFPAVPSGNGGKRRLQAVCEVPVKTTKSQMARTSDFCNARMSTTAFLIMPCLDLYFSSHLRHLCKIDVLFWSAVLDQKRFGELHGAGGAMLHWCWGQMQDMQRDPRATGGSVLGGGSRPEDEIFVIK